MRRLTALLAVVALTGCQAKTYSSRDKVSTEPMVVDQAMQQRQWEPVKAYYENGDVASWTTGFGYTSKQLGNYPSTYVLTDTGTFVLNVFTLPYTAYVERDGVVTGGSKLQPSYTANPPLPPSTQPAE
ncbi:MAG: hypothetical protein QM754_03140 [Tepidisphaeraceae bacterium]